MKKIILILVVVFAGTSVLYAQSSSNKEDNPNAPEISFEKTVHDYGTIEVGGDGTCYFEFENTGKEPLILSRPRSSCGCTVPTWPKQPILPGKTDKVKVTYNTKRVGRINKSVTIYSNAKNNPVILRIKGEVSRKPKEEAPVKNIDQGGSPVNK
ncbi:MAG: DUF1573 domain-containing protein [Bacteroidales bacterium]|nr:DUF1573 domain-containing protein [Bacteroidales bacterium]MCF8388723.1 DUF1573 domain-containing protein [Bacteroidales bacterium]MCF8399456.1 DUF1573 domain-containing protein [Bacteroidales bacterium]